MTKQIFIYSILLKSDNATELFHINNAWMKSDKAITWKCCVPNCIGLSDPDYAICILLPFLLLLA